MSRERTHTTGASRFAGGWLPALLAGGVMACTSDESAQPSTVTFTDSAGIRLIHNPPPDPRDTVIDAVEVFRIGRVEGPDTELFHAINEVAVTEDGLVLVANGGPPSVRVYDASGGFVRVLGREGTGPGEFGLPGTITTWRDTIYIADLRSGFAAFFQADGELLAAFPTLLADGSALTVNGGTDAGVVAERVRLADRRPAAEGEIIVDSVSLVVVPAAQLANIAGVQTAELDAALQVVTRYAPYRRVGMPLGERTVSGQPLFEPRAGHAIGNNEVYVSYGLPYQIDIMDLRGRLTRRIRRAVPPVEITADHVQRVLDGVNALRESGKVDARALDEARRRSTLPRVGWLPQIASLIVEPGGDLWVQRIQLDEPADFELRLLRQEYGETHWDVFDAEGRFRHTVRLPARFVPHALRASTIFGVLRDENDIEFVAGFRATR